MVHPPDLLLVPTGHNLTFEGALWNHLVPFEEGNPTSAMMRSNPATTPPTLAFVVGFDGLRLPGEPVAPFVVMTSFAPGSAPTGSAPTEVGQIVETSHNVASPMADKGGFRFLEPRGVDARSRS